MPPKLPSPACPARPLLNFFFTKQNIQEGSLDVVANALSCHVHFMGSSSGIFPQNCASEHQNIKPKNV